MVLFPGIKYDLFRTNILDALKCAPSQFTLMLYINASLVLESVKTNKIEKRILTSMHYYYQSCTMLRTCDQVLELFL